MAHNGVSVQLRPSLQFAALHMSLLEPDPEVSEGPLLVGYRGQTGLVVLSLSLAALTDAPVAVTTRQPCGRIIRDGTAPIS